LTATGYVVPQKKADVASKATGRLEALEVEEGSRVREGQVIARLESQDVNAAMEEAAANVEVAKARLSEARAELKETALALRRAKELIGKRFITLEDHDAVVARHEKAQASVESAKAAIDAAQAAFKGAKTAVEYTMIRAPFDGVILTKHADIGDVVAPFSSTTQSKGAVVSMADLGTLEVEADVSESNLAKVTLDQPCEIELDALPGIRLRGQVHQIVPTVDRSKATVLVKVRFLDRDDRVLPDMSAKVAFLSQELSAEDRTPRTAAPPSALLRRDGKEIVFVVQEGKLAEVPVETGERLGEWQVIKSGVKAGDVVVLNPPDTLREGTEIRSDDATDRRD
jgi:RND family efflux transporter MFP subunit